jgi:predicted RND superfamily exporter protein
MGTQIVTRYAAWVVRHRLLVVAGALVTTIILALGAARLHVEIDPDRMLPQEHPHMKTAQEVRRLFNVYNLVVVGLFPKDGDVFSPAFLKKLAEVTARIGKIPGLKPALLQSLAAPNVKYLHGTVEGMDVEPVMATPPTDAAGAAEVRRRAFAEPAYVGTLVSTDGSAATVLADFDLTPQLPGYRHLDAAVREAIAAADDGTFEVAVAGPVVMLARVDEYAGRMIYYIPLALLVIGLVHYHAFRTLQALFLPLLTALLAVVWAVGLMGIFGVPLDPYNATTPILILAVAAGHAVQILKRFYEELDRTGDVSTAIVDSLGRVGPVMIAAGTVAALSFCSLATFRTATIRTFGLFTAFGIVSALAIELTVIPAVRALLPAPRSREQQREAAAHPWLDAFLRTSARAATGNRRPVFVGVALLLVACAALAARVHIDMSLKRLFRAQEPIRREDARLNERFAGTNTLELLVQGDADGALEEPAALAAIDGLEAHLAGEPTVGKVISYVDFVRTMHAALNADRPDVARLPERRGLIAQYLFLYSTSGGAEAMDTMLEPTHRSAFVRVLVKDDGIANGARLIDVVDAWTRTHFPPGLHVRYTGSLASGVAHTEVMVEGKLRNMVQVSFITFGVAALLLRSLLGGLLVAIPLGCTVAVTFAVMGLLGIPLDDVTSAICAMAIGIGADYAMYFLFRVREELARDDRFDVALRRALLTSGKAVLFVSSAIAVGYATLCLSGFVFHVRLGGLVSLAMVVSSVTTLVLLPSLVAAFRPRFLERAPAAAAPVPASAAA